MQIVRKVKTALFSRKLNEAGGMPDGEFDIRVLEKAGADIVELRKRGVETEYFGRSRICFAAFVNGVIAGSGWAFLKSRTVRRLGLPETVYLGAFFVNPEFRGTGIYKALLRHMCCVFSSRYDFAVAEAAESNELSARGLMSAGFTRLGTASGVQLLGCINLPGRFSAVSDRKAFVLIGNSWEASENNPTSKHQIAKRLAESGHTVLWVDGAGMRKPQLSSPSDRSRIISRLRRALAGPAPAASGIWRISPLIVPLPSSSAARAVNSMIYRARIRSALKRLRLNEPALINFLPTVPKVVEKWKGKKIYYCVDRWDQFKGYDAELMEKLDAECCRTADLVIASAQDLYERCLKHNENTHLISHGVDWPHFAGPLRGQAEVQKSSLNRRRRIGFFGLISEWVDQDLLLEIAGRLENIELVLAGKADVDVSRLQGQANITMCGPVPYMELPKLAASFDVGIIPFKVNELTRAVNPIKLREMLAAGCPVVSTALPEVERITSSLPDYAVSIARDNDSFVAAVKGVLDANLQNNVRKSFSDAMQNEDWSSKVETILGLLRLAGAVERR